MTVKISIEGEGLQYSGETNLHKAAQIIAFMGTEQSSLQNSGASAAAPSSLMAPATPAMQTNMTPRQFINQAGAKTNVQKIAVIAKYLKDRSREVFVRNEIVEEFRRAGEVSPKNIGRDIKETVIAGYICESPDQTGEYYLTNEGEEAIIEKFTMEKDGKKSKPKAKKAKSTASSSEPTNASLKDLVFIPKIDGVPSYWDIKKSDRIHWILFAAKAHKVDELTNKDIEYVAKMLGDNIGSSTVDAFSKTNRKQSYLHKNGTTYRILQPGIDHLQGLLTVKENGKEGK